MAKLSPNELKANRFILATQHVIKHGDDPEARPEVVAEFWAAFVDFFDAYIAGEVIRTDGSHLVINRILEE